MLIRFLAGKVVAEAKDHEGAKSGRVAWYRPKDRIVTGKHTNKECEIYLTMSHSVGFSKNTERHIRGKKKEERKQEEGRRIGSPLTVSFQFGILVVWLRL